MIRSPRFGGRMHGGPHHGRIMAYDKVVMPVFDAEGKRIGCYLWIDVPWTPSATWEYDSDDGTIAEIYPGGETP